MGCGWPCPQENLPPGGGRIAGVRVVEGSVQRAVPLVRVIRDDQMIYEVSFQKCLPST